MSDQLRMPRVVITSFFSFPFKGSIKGCRTPQPCVMSFFLFLSHLFLILPCLHCVYIYNIVQSSKQTARPVVQILLNSLDFWLSKTITSILLRSVVLLKPIHAMTFRTKFLLFVTICVPPNNPITACGTTSFPGYHSFPKWAMGDSLCMHGTMQCSSFVLSTMYF